MIDTERSAKGEGCSASRGTTPGAVTLSAPWGKLGATLYTCIGYDTEEGQDLGLAQHTSQQQQLQQLSQAEACYGVRQ